MNVVDGFFFPEETNCVLGGSRSSRAVRVGKNFPGRRISGFRAMVRGT